MYIIIYYITKVSEVRNKAAKSSSNIFFQLLSNETEYKIKSLRILEAFAYSVNYHYRQLFIKMCTKLFTKKDIVKDIIIGYFIKLANDKIVNVRITMAKTLNKLIKGKIVI
jgi:hypothetical protein